MCAVRVKFIVSALFAVDGAGAVSVWRAGGFCAAALLAGAGVGLGLALLGCAAARSFFALPLLQRFAFEYLRIEIGFRL